ncbi:hypothetical protein Ddc_13785 [Ditylenchus destructor]|nr:hypothetical protein Ddc_13785 [Ditylenchus destructor]
MRFPYLRFSYTCARFQHTCARFRAETVQIWSPKDSSLDQSREITPSRTRRRATPALFKLKQLKNYYMRGPSRADPCLEPQQSHYYSESNCKQSGMNCGRGGGALKRAGGRVAGTMRSEVDIAMNTPKKDHTPQSAAILDPKTEPIHEYGQKNDKYVDKQIQRFQFGPI